MTEQQNDELPKDEPNAAAAGVEQVSSPNQPTATVSADGNSLVPADAVDAQMIPRTENAVAAPQTGRQQATRKWWQPQEGRNFIVRLNDVTVRYRARGKTTVVLRNTTMELPRGRSVAIVGPMDSGKSTLIRLIAGIQAPTTGQVKQGCAISWPFGARESLSQDLSARENCLFVARIHGYNPQETMRAVKEFCNLGDDFEVPMNRVSVPQKVKFALSLSIALDFDVYLLDGGLGGGNPEFTKKLVSAFMEKAKHADVIFSTRNAAAAKNYCESCIVIDGGRLKFYDDIDEVIELAKESSG